MDERFPLFKLPSLAIREVVNLLGIAHVLHLTFISKFFNSFLKNYKLSSTEIKWKFEGRRQSFKFRLGICFPRQRRGDVEFDYTDGGDESNGVAFQGNINGKLMSMKRHGYVDFYIHKESRTRVSNGIPGPNDQEIMDNLTRHLLDIVRVESFSVDYGFIQGVDFFKCYIWNHTREFRNLEIRVRNNGQLEDESLRFLINEVPVENSLTLHVDTKSGEILDNLKPLSSKILMIHDCAWLSIDDLLNSTSEKITTNFTRPTTNEDILKLIKCFRNGSKLGNLKEADITLVVLNMNLQEIDNLDGVEQTNFTDDFGVTFRRAVKRVTDGKYAYFTLNTTNFYMMIQ